MNGALVLPSVPVSARERMLTVLDALAYGLTPPLSCSQCRDSLADRCPECAQSGAWVGVILTGIAAVEDAGTKGDARDAYVACLLGIAGAGDE